MKTKFSMENDLIYALSCAEPRIYLCILTTNGPKLRTDCSFVGNWATCLKSLRTPALLEVIYQFVSKCCGAMFSTAKIQHRTTRLNGIVLELL